MCYKNLHFQVCIFQDQPWNPPDFMDEICWISSWNLPDFMKFTWFHEICQISPWNLPDFMNTGFLFYSSEPIQIYSMVYHWMLYFSSEPKSLAWNPLDFMKSTRFHGHEISTRFHAWNPPNFTMKSARFHHEICRISSWNLPDFMVYHWMLYFSSEPIQIYIVEVLAMKSARFHAWNLPDFMKFIWFHEICQISPWNPPDFMVYHWMLYFSSEQYRYTCISPCHEIHWISCMKSAGFHEIRPKWAKDPWS